MARSPPPSPPPGPTSTRLSPHTPQDLDDLKAAAESYGYGYHGQQPTRVLADLVTDFTNLRPLLISRRRLRQLRPSQGR
ncbi:hypothetical protein GCM10010256_50280 [Streptomyces coeruleorubidus]|nr:hypothetical protein GCM10010256_50280 [Streptomyces coeruleorubidus]